MGDNARYLCRSVVVELLAVLRRLTVILDRLLTFLMDFSTLVSCHVRVSHLLMSFLSVFGIKLQKLIFTENTCVWIVIDPIKRQA